MRIAVIGGGAIGSLIAAKLVEDGNEVLIHARGQHGAEMALNGLHITGIWNRIISPDEWFVSLDEIEKPPELENYYDQAIITGKSKDTSNLCKIANFFTKGPVLSLQNGIGNLEILHDYFFEKSAVGVTTNAVTKIEPGRIIWVSKGKLEISGNAGQEFVSSLNCLSPDFFVKPDEILWNKLLINVAINPIAAMCGVRNGELAKEPLLSQCESIMLEAANIARLSGVMVANDIQLIENLHKVISDTSENICSMLSDVKSGKDTEIDFLCGQVVLRGEKLGVPTPLNSMLLSQIKSLK